MEDIRIYFQPQKYYFMLVFRSKLKSFVYTDKPDTIDASEENIRRDIADANIGGWNLFDTCPKTFLKHNTKPLS